MALLVVLDEAGHHVDADVLRARFEQPRADREIPATQIDDAPDAVLARELADGLCVEVRVREARAAARAEGPRGSAPAIVTIDLREDLSRRAARVLGANQREPALAHERQHRVWGYRPDATFDFGPHG